MAGRYEQFVKHKIDVALALVQGGCGGNYSDAVILLSSGVSAIAADLWPGDRVDRRRFIEAWVRFADPALLPARISLPMLVQELRHSSRTGEAENLEQLRPQMFGPGYSARVVTDFDIDATENEILRSCPALGVGDVRRFSYPAVFYRHVRSALVHEYHLTDHATTVPMTEREAGVSYSNRIGRRLIHYHPDWLADVLRSIAAAADGLTPPLSVPSSWWIDG